MHLLHFQGLQTVNCIRRVNSTMVFYERIRNCSTSADRRGDESRQKRNTILRALYSRKKYFLSHRTARPQSNRARY